MLETREYAIQIKEQQGENAEKFISDKFNEIADKQYLINQHHHYNLNFYHEALMIVRSLNRP